MNKTLTLSLAAAAMIATGATAAFADQHKGDGEHTRAEAQAHAAQMFARMDANSDGALNAADREARTRQRFERMDTDGDGMLSFAETQAAREMRGERSAEMGERRGGMRKMMRHHGGKRGGHMAMLQRADTDGDQSISQAEFTAAMLARFDATDADNDGTVTADERKAAHAEMRERMKERRAARAE